MRNLFTFVGLGLVAVLASCLLVSPWQAAEAATPDNAVFVEIKDSEASNAKVIERWRIYGGSYALVIGIDDYTNGWPRLSNAINDAERIASELEDQGFHVTLRTDLKTDELRNEFRRFFTLKGQDPDARLFVWYSGHGYSELGEGYLVPADAPLPTNPEFLLSALQMRDFSGLVRLARAKHAMAVFDSCFAGSIFSVQRSPPPAAITRATVKPVRQFLTSGDADQKVSDDGSFSKMLIDALRGDARADANGDGYLTGSELALHMEQRVTNLTEGQQTPRSGKLRDPRFDGGDFVFLLPRKKQQTQVALAGPATGASTATRSQDPAPPRSMKSGPDEATFDLEFWNSIKNSNDATSFLAYLEAFPNGRFAPLARLKVSSLQPREPEPAAEPEPEPEPEPEVVEEKAPAEPATAQMSDDQRELMIWSAIKDSNNAPDYQAFLQQFPAGNFAVLAQFRLDQLEKSQAAKPKPVEQQTALVVQPPAPKAAISLQPIDEDYVATRNANVRAQPEANSSKIGFLKKGKRVFVRGKVKGERWLSVQLDDGTVGYVYAPLLASAAAVQKQQAAQAARQLKTQQAVVAAPKQIRLEPIEEQYRAVKDASVRAKPNVSAKRVNFLQAGTSIYVSGKVKGENWLAVDREGAHLGYVYAPLLQPAGKVAAAKPSAAATTQAAQPQTAALPPPGDPFDGTYTGTYSTSVSELPGCEAGNKVEVKIKDLKISGRFYLGSKILNLSGKLRKDGRIEQLYGTGQLMIGEFKGEVNSESLAGKFEVEKKSSSEYAGPIYCTGAYTLKR